MGSTVTTGKIAAAFRMSQDRICFVLFERVHETNISPWTPEWRCCFIGTAEAAVRRIFDWGSSCEGGMLRGHDGRIKPENYIAAWLRELANPVVMPDRPIRLYASASWSAPLPNESDEFLARIEEQGREDIAETIRIRNVAELSLHAHADLLLALYGQWQGELHCLPAGRILKGCDRPDDAQRDRSLGYAPKHCAIRGIDIPTAIRVSEYEHLLKGSDGTWVNEGWAYSIIRDRIAAMSDREVQTPGYYRRAIPLLRAAIENAPWPPHGTIVRLDRGACQTKRALELFDHTVEQESLHVPNGTTSLPWSKEIGNAVSYIPREAVSWEIPETVAAEPALLL